jgi:hypothetical protein
MQKTVKLVEEDTGKPLDLDKVSLDDPKTYEMLSAGGRHGRFPAGVLLGQGFHATSSSRSRSRT